MRALGDQTFGSLALDNAAWAGRTPGREAVGDEVLGVVEVLRAAVGVVKGEE